MGNRGHGRRSETQIRSPAVNYVQITDEHRRQMLDRIGVESVDQLYATLGPQFRLEKPLDLPPAQSEPQLQNSLHRLGAANRPAGAPDLACFLGAGAYDHFIPEAVNSLTAKGEFVTAYTPYQAEASQGALQAFFEFQTQIARLTALDVANASLYEGATAVAEAVLMAVNVTGRRRVLVGETLHPHYRQVLQTYLNDLPVELVVLAQTAGRIDAQTVREALDGDTAALVVQSPNVYGQIEDWSALFAAAHEQDQTLAVAVPNPIACALLKRPGDCGADIAAGEGQPLGIPMQYGGPYLGLFAARRHLMRKMPGRLVGQTVDGDGRRGFCLTLQTREQHIRGAKATSNVCTNQGLLALRATVYLSAMGKQGLREAARQCYHKAHYAAAQIAALDGYRLAHDGPFFHEFVVDCPVPAQAIVDAGRQRAIAPGVSPGIYPGIDCAQLGIGGENQLLIAVTEKRTAGQIDQLCALLREAKR